MNGVISDPQMAYLFPPRGVTAISIQLIRSSTEQMFNRAVVLSITPTEVMMLFSTDVSKDITLEDFQSQQQHT